jgi:hypothetical protein
MLIDTLGVVQLVIKDAVVEKLDPASSANVIVADADPPVMVLDVDLIYAVAFVVNV